MISRDTASLGGYGATVERALAELRDERVVERMWEGDHTVWGPDPDEIANRLGWLRSPEETERALPDIRGLAEAARREGIEHVLLLGMGGSSLAPETFALSLGGADGHPDLAVLDSTDPQAVLGHAERLDLSRTLFIVSTKSGGTVETFSFFKYFYNRVAEAVGEERASSRFVAITDPGGFRVQRPGDTRGRRDGPRAGGDGRGRARDSGRHRGRRRERRGAPDGPGAGGRVRREDGGGRPRGGDRDEPRSVQVRQGARPRGFGDEHHRGDKQAVADHAPGDARLLQRPQGAGGADQRVRRRDVRAQVRPTFGVPVREIQEGIRHGVRKVNVDTDLRLAATGAIRKAFAEKPDEFDARYYLKPAREAMQAVVRARMEAFGQAGHAGDYEPIPLEEMATRYKEQGHQLTVT